MTIAPLRKVTLAGMADQKAATLAFLQAEGCMHLVPLSETADRTEAGPARGAEDALKALRFLAEVEGARRPVRHDPDFDVDAFAARVLDLKQAIRETGDRRDFLKDRIAALDPWGELVFPDKADLGGLALWFYELPVRHRAALDGVKMPWEIVAQDNRHLYVAVIAPDEPDADLLPVPRVHTGHTPRSALLEQLEDAELELEALEAERTALTRYLRLFRAHMSEAETQAELAFAMTQTRDDAAIFAVQGWVPDDRLARLDSHATAEGLAMLVEPAAWNETPPTLLEQPPAEAAGVDLAMFYQVPNYRAWDPSVVLMASFAVFFAMIVADAGYGLVIAGGLLAWWRRLGRSPAGRAWRRMGMILAGGTVIYGVIVGSYFGTAPRGDGPLAGLAVLSLDDFDTMMRLSIVIGVAHIVLAIAMNAWVVRDRPVVRAQLGWIAVILGGLGLWLSGQGGVWAAVSGLLMAAGLVAILLWSSERPVETRADWLWRGLDGARALSGAMGAFGDVLSYMRLFALGLASASLAITFNGLAAQVTGAVPGIGLLLGLLILLIGHGLNFGLAMMSGVVHGLRLNYIEFFKWGLPEEGVAFRPLTRKEVQE